ncbi:MAG TPA: hypothetical protein VHV80_10990 [Steroidobacteraceae bacterium]|jgi:hypothetical protein|nr:hypothetical protein [Steroidobacteraceae bacterium]
MVKARLRGLLGWPEADASEAKKAPVPEKRPGRASRYQAVSIAYPAKCCAAVKALAGQRFLAGNAPALPLPACSLSNQCKCSFQKYDDRRDDNRRLPGEVTKWYAGSEKRRFRGRRRVD